MSPGCTVDDDQAHGTAAGSARFLLAPSGNQALPWSRLPGSLGRVCLGACPASAAGSQSWCISFVKCALASQPHHVPVICGYEHRPLSKSKSHFLPRGTRFFLSSGDLAVAFKHMAVWHP